MKIKEFIDRNYHDAIELKKGFQKTENKPWDAMTVLSELYVQIGHLSYLIEKNESTAEKGRNIHNLGDEVSDVFLQIFALTWKHNLDLTEFFKEEDVGATINDMCTLAGQITETTMEMYEFRHLKSREGFETLEDFLKYKINCLVCVVYNFGKSYNLDMNKEFRAMIDDATNFLRNFQRG
jgi:hypothetical protein